MLQILLVIQVVIALCMIALVLVQHGKGADMGASFGAGASNTIFGSSGSTPFLVKITILFAVFYFANSLWIGYITTQQKKAAAGTHSSLLTKQPVAPVPVAPKQSADDAALRAALSSATQAANKSNSPGKPAKSANEGKAGS
jgi:preprotein translocase subunit SecG